MDVNHFLFEILMNQLGIPAEIRNHEAFSQAEIEQSYCTQTKVKIWEFRFVFENILPFELFFSVEERSERRKPKTENQVT